MHEHRYMRHTQEHQLVASFLLRRSFSHGPRWKATTAYESSTVRKMRATSWLSVDGNARDCVSLGTNLRLRAFRR